MRTIYEWDIETVDEFGDITDHRHADKLQELPPLTDGQRLVLVRNKVDEFGDVLDREWAYVEDGELPEHFDEGSRVPQRFHKELAR